MARENSTVRTPSFSAKIATEIPPIQSRLIDPETKRTSMNNQQQPMQYMECRNPIRIAPSRPFRQWCSMKPIGETQWERQASFVRVTCQRPAATRVAADRRRAGPINIGPIRPRAIRPQRAATPKSPHRPK